MNRIQTVLSSAAVAALMAVTPVFASADTLNANASNGVVINGSGIVHVVGANVTAVSSGVVNAVTTLGTSVINWIVNISASTKIAANGSAHASTTDISVGDKVSFTGTLSGLGSSVTVAASNVRSMITFPKLNGISGKITSVNTASSSFSLKAGDRIVTVHTTASTTILIDGATSTIASLQTGDKVKVTGTVNARGTIITASKITVKSERENDGSNKGEDRKEKKENSKKGDDNRVSDNKGSLNFKSILARFHFGKESKND
ncbi:MAG: DUF5666 domain-containing protein [Candidatus Kaiserbacteria bacterium]|nr:DUF5666 domain-containing protein [Candidatus Kaiserbacteria bacterium]